MAVRTLYEVNIVQALGGFESCVHGLHIEAAIRQAWMAGGTGGARTHGVIFVTGEAAEALVNPDRSAVVARVQHPCSIRPVALVAQRLPLVVADLHIPFPLAHRGQGQIGQWDGQHFSPVKERE